MWAWQTRDHTEREGEQEQMGKQESVLSKNTQLKMCPKNKLINIYKKTKQNKKPSVCVQTQQAFDLTMASSLLSTMMLITN